jgi:glutamine amidotransferase
MKSISVGIIDYGLGNHASILNSLRRLGFRVKITNDMSELDVVDVLLLPGVGAFSGAMKSLNELGLVAYLKRQALQKRPMIGICLGMQLLASASYEHGYTVGLDLIPGEVKALPLDAVHIGWNTLECTKIGDFLAHSGGQDFYFNHSFCFYGADEYKAAVSRHSTEFAAVIRHGKIVGVQFHPEKSQVAGKVFLKKMLQDLAGA